VGGIGPETGRAGRPVAELVPVGHQHQLALGVSVNGKGNQAHG
jgi:antitoxin (DNA-binding transcriptional repressor) of toxin-antitoxin stability system